MELAQGLPAMTGSELFHKPVSAGRALRVRAILTALVYARDRALAELRR